MYELQNQKQRISFCLAVDWDKEKLDHMKSLAEKLAQEVSVEAAATADLEPGEIIDDDAAETSAADASTSGAGRAMTVDACPADDGLTVTSDAEASSAVNGRCNSSKTANTSQHDVNTKTANTSSKTANTSSHEEKRHSKQRKHKKDKSSRHKKHKKRDASKLTCRRKLCTRISCVIVFQ